ncbi:hypothetical protein DsansV1_C22g0172761 [Dioscorea sansibarensis]
MLRWMLRTWERAWLQCFMLNRASSLHNAGLLEESLIDCDRAIASVSSYVKVNISTIIFTLSFFLSF